MEALRGLLAKVARSPASTVLLTGESGTGKDLAAKVLHYNSDRANRPFMNITCSAIPEALLESELFGHERGAFTDARQQKRGLFEQADGGTVFLDEIGEMVPALQAKLLRFLEEKTFKRVGGHQDIRVDVRVVAATNRVLADQVKGGHFREDLFYRLNVFPIEAPSLRERREDIPALIDHFIARFNVEEGKRVAGCAGETLALLCAFDWPGNVRQLENAVYRAIVLADAPFLQPHDFPAVSGLAAPLLAASGPQDQGDSLGADGRVAHVDLDLPPLPDTPIRILDERGHLRTLEEIERDLIQHAIEVYAGHMSEIARRLGIGRSTLYRKVREQGLEGSLKEAG